MSFSIPEIDRGASGREFRRVYRPLSSDHGRIEVVLVRTVMLEFLVVAGTSFVTSVVYFKAILTQRPPAAE
jgi:hypothetical protein